MCVLHVANQLEQLQNAVKWMKAHSGGKLKERAGH